METQLFLRLLTAFLCISGVGGVCVCVCEGRSPSPRASPEAAASCPPPILASWRNDQRDQAQACDSQQEPEAHTRGDRALRADAFRVAVLCSATTWGLSPSTPAPPAFGLESLAGVRRSPLCFLMKPFPPVCSVMVLWATKYKISTQSEGTPF